MIVPRMATFTMKKRMLDDHKPVTNVELPRNSNWYPCCSHANCIRLEGTNVNESRYIPGQGPKRRGQEYQRSAIVKELILEDKTAETSCTTRSTAYISGVLGEQIDLGNTWLVQTLLNVTKANVWASIVDGRSFLAKANGIRMELRRSCGRKARRSSANDACAFAFGEELKYNNVLYGEKLCRWSIRIRW